MVWDSAPPTSARGQKASCLLLCTAKGGRPCTRKFSVAEGSHDVDDALDHVLDDEYNDDDNDDLDVDCFRC